jgi:hypothetical protein
MAASEYSATFTDLSAIHSLLVTIEELAAAAMELRDDDSKLRTSLLWSIQKMTEMATRDVEQMEAAEA